MFLSTELFSQWNLSLSTAQEYSDNPFHNPTPISSYISSFNFGVEREIESFGIGYYGNYSTFNEFNIRNYYWHQFGFWNATENVMFGLYAEQRINQIEYEYFDYTNYNAYIKHKTNIESINIYTQGSFTLTKYSLLSDLDNWMGSLGVKLNKSFETKTTLIGGFTFNYKDYYSTNLDTTQTNGMGRLSSSESSTAITSQLIYYVRAAQSLTASTGLAIQYTSRNIIGGTAQTIRELGYAYGDESQYFDDPISYEGFTLNAQLTQLLPADCILKASYFYNSKEYPSQSIFVNEEIMDEDVIRLDEQHIISLNFTKIVYLNELNDHQLNLSLGYQNIVNSSNSYWYDYKSSQINLGIDFQF
jgi:hypothetical protein